MPLLGKVAKRLYRLYKLARFAKAKRKAREQAAGLYLQSNVTLKSLANAIIDSLGSSITPQEKLWVDRIELLRRELESSQTEILIVDYGAGSTGLNPTDEEMYQGRVVTRTIGDMCRDSSQPYFWSLLLFKLVREFRPSVCLELGTALGISASYQAAAAKLNQLGKIVTLEGSESLASLARQHFRRLGLDNISVIVGRFQDTLDKVLNEYVPIDYAFIDGHHDEKATLAYFQQVYPFLSERALLVFDDISWSSGMKRAWSAIETDKRVKISLDLLSHGICIIDSSIDTKQNFRIPIA